MPAPPLTQGVVRLQILIGQFEEALDPFQRHFGLQDAVEHPGEGVERDDEQPHQGDGGEHLQGGGARTGAAVSHTGTTIGAPASSSGPNILLSYLDHSD